MTNNFTIKTISPSTKTVPKRFIMVTIVLLIFFLLFLTKSIRSIKSGQNADPVIITLLAASEKNISKVKIYRVSPRSRIHELDKQVNNETSIWSSTNHYFKNIWIYGPNDTLRHIDRIDINIAGRRFSFTQQQLIEDWIRLDIEEHYITAAGADDFVLLEAPLTPNQKRSIIPLFRSTLNWSGDHQLFYNSFCYALLPIMIIVSTLVALILAVSVLQYIKAKQTYTNSSFLILLVIIYIFLYLIPQISSQYYFDDIVWSTTTPGFYKMNSDLSLLEAIWADIQSSLSDARFLPIANVCYRLPFYYIDNVVLYKIYILSMVLLNISLFIILLRAVTNNSVLPAFLVFFLPCFIELRASYHDPILGYYGLVQVLFTFLLSSLIFLKYYLTTEKRVLLILSVFAYICAILTYEVAYVLVVLHCYLVYRYKRAILPSIKVLIPFLTPVVLIGICVVYLKVFIVNPATQYTGTQIEFSIFAILKTLFFQLFSALPLSFFLSLKQSLTLKDIWININNIHFCVLSVIFFVICYGLLKKIEKTDILYDNALAVVGVLLFVLPAIPVSLSIKYQKGLSLGIGYLPVYIQWFGLLLLLGKFLCALARRGVEGNLVKIKAKSLTITFCAAFCIVLFTFASNKVGIAKQNKLSYPNYLLKVALENNILDNGSGVERVVLLNQYMRREKKYEYLFFNYLNKHVEVVSADDYARLACRKGDDSSNGWAQKNVYVLEFPPGNLEESYVKIGRVSKITHNCSAIDKIRISHLKYFVSKERDYRYVYYRYGSDDAVREMNNIFESACKRFRLYSVSFGEKDVDFDSLRLF